MISGHILPTSMQISEQLDLKAVDADSYLLHTNPSEECPQVDHAHFE